MTASSIDFFPCRVKLIGLPDSSTSPSAANTSTRPPIAKIQSISRNLFGSPDPGDMEALYQLEAERLHSYLLQRYNFDTQVLECANEEKHKEPTKESRTSHTTTIPEMQPTQLPSLIEQEMQQYEQCLKRGKKGFHRQFLESEKNAEKTSIKGNELFKNAHRSSDSTNFISPTIERQNPVFRQSLIKESFKIRKNRLCKKNSSQYFNPEPSALDSNQNFHRNFGILQSSQPKTIPQCTCDSFEEGKELSTCNNIICQRHIDVKESRNRITSYDENCTTLSLQLVVSTQNVS